VTEDAIRTQASGWYLRAALGLAFMACAATPVDAAPLTVWGADSLEAALDVGTAQFSSNTGIPVNTFFGGSGTLRRDIEAQNYQGSSKPDLFASADLANPLRLQQEGLAGPVVNFASNTLVALAAPGVNVNSSNLLSTLLDPAVKLGTSTPGNDPLGDYTEQLFANADALVPGAKAALDAKAQRLLLGSGPSPVPTGKNALAYYLSDTQQADIFIAYSTLATAARAIDPSLQEIAIPSNIDVTVQYGLTILNGADPNASLLEDYILSAAGQLGLSGYGFGPPAPVPEPASVAVLGIALSSLVLLAAMRRWREPS
jgi:molybdate transport system substrate-binding protein